MTLCDRQIEKLSLVAPFNPAQVQPASYDVRLADDFLEMRRCTLPIDPHNLVDDLWQRSQSDQFLLQRGQFVLGRTVEHVTIQDDMVGFIHGCSTLGRLGLLVQISGTLDPGFSGIVTLSLRNVGPRPIILTSGMKIGQVEWRFMAQTPKLAYGSARLGSHYQGQIETQPPKSLQRCSVSQMVTA